MDIDNITNVKSFIINRRSYTNPFNPVFFMLLAEKLSSNPCVGPIPRMIMISGFFH